jgi:DNA-binding SARP family transcriptional activator/class 3 adenylate cyclase/tetratricopeptide (TPR) repeat protein
VEFRILGPLEVLDEGRPVLLPGGRARVLLALLILRAGEVVSADRLIEELWGESPPPTVQTALQGLVSSLRKRLEPDRRAGEAPTILRTVGSGYLLAIDAVSLDANRFKALLDEARTLPITDRGPRLRRALEIWRGSALADVRDEPAVQREVEALDDLRRGALEERIEADLAGGLAGELVPELERLVDEFPLRERLRSLLMLALYRAGRQAEALEVYRSARQTLVDELGIEPGPGLRHLEQAILRQDTSLNLPRAPDRPGPLPQEPVDSPEWLGGERKMTTAVFVECSAPSGVDEDVEVRRETTALGLDVVRELLLRHGAQVEELFGDELIGLFGVPVAHEDDAVRAVRAAIELRRDLMAVVDERAGGGGPRHEFRAGIDTGEVVVSPAGLAPGRIFGPPIQNAARLQRAAEYGEVLVGEGSERLLRGAAILEPLTDAGAGQATLTAWRLLDLVPGTRPARHVHGTPFVGRMMDLNRIEAAFDRSVSRHAPYRLGVLGEPGIGKSRLAAEFGQRVGRRASLLIGRCPAYGQGITLRPLREIVQAVGRRRGLDGLTEVLRGEDDGEWIAAQVAGGVALTAEPGRPDELFPAVRRLFEVLAARQPLVIVLEDLHWAEPAFLDLVDYLVDWSQGPLFLLCLARPELLDARPMWGIGGESADTLYLEPLDRADSERQIAALAGATLDQAVQSEIAETARGNPLFVEQLVAAAADEGWRSAAPVPASINALLAARLDRLDQSERDVLRAAAVVGTDFTAAAVAALLPDLAKPLLELNLPELERKQLIRPGETTGAFQFRHVLVQLAAYRGMTRRDRARLHERYADWVEQRPSEQPAELDEVLGYHLEQAVQHRRVLRPADDGVGALAGRAGEHLARAGMRAFARFDVGAADNLISRALPLLPPGHADERPISFALSQSRLVLGRHPEADALLADMEADAALAGDEVLGRRIHLDRLRIRLITGPDPMPLDALGAEAEAGLRFFTSSEDDTGAANVCYILVLVSMRRGDLAEMERYARLEHVHALRSGSIREEAASRWMIAFALVLGSTAVDDAITECEELLPWSGSEHPGVLSELAHLRAMRGEFAVSRQLIARARRLAIERIHARRPLMFAARSSAEIELLAGDVSAAESELRLALQMASEMNEREVAAGCAARLARLVSVPGRRDEADELTKMSAELAPSEHRPDQALVLAARAAVLALRRDHGTAEGLLRQAIQLVPVEMLNLRADLLVDLAAVLGHLGHPAEAAATQREAIGLYERKGNLAAAANAARSARW